MFSSALTQIDIIDLIETTHFLWIWSITSKRSSYIVSIKFVVICCLCTTYSATLSFVFNVQKETQLLWSPRFESLWFNKRSFCNRQTVLKRWPNNVIWYISSTRNKNKNVVWMVINCNLFRQCWLSSSGAWAQW